MTKPIVRAARCLFPGGDAVLAGYDEDDRLVLGIKVETTPAWKWAAAGVTEADLKQLQQHQKEKS